MDEGNPLEDDFTLGDVVEKKNKIKTRNKYIIIGAISLFVLISIIIIIIVASSNKKDSPKKEEKKEDDKKKDEEKEEEGEEEDEDDQPQELSNIAVINCTFYIETISSETNILNEEYDKNSRFYIFINGKKIPFSKKYKFENVGEQLVTFDIYEDINMDYMFKDIPELFSVKMDSESTNLNPIPTPLQKAEIFIS